MAATHKNEKTSELDKLIVKLDHIAYRVKTNEREEFIMELKRILPYKKYKQFQVSKMNAITTCLKLHNTSPVIVISEGLDDDSIVEQYSQKFGSRVHHLAYEVRNIEKVFEIQKANGIEFTSEGIIGSEKEGIKQIFTKPTQSTNHIIEYIQRFGDFDGFFTPTNIEDLMKSTEDLNRLGEA